MKPKRIHPAELFGVAVICAGAIGMAAFLPGQLRFLVTAVAWLLGVTLVSVGGVSLTRHDSRTAWMSGPLLAVVFTIGTAFFVSSTLRGAAIVLTAAHAAFMGVVLFQAFQQRERAAAPARAAIRVRTETPRPSRKPAAARPPAPQSEPPETESSHEIDAGFEQALLSRLSADTDDESIGAHESEPPPEAIRFQQAAQNVFQRIERGQDGDGREWLEGTVRVDFLRNQKTSIVHIPFWPAFHVRPDVSTELLEGPQLTIETKTVERWGIRLELTRRAAGLDPDFAELAFFVSTHSAAREAA